MRKIVLALCLALSTLMASAKPVKPAKEQSKKDPRIEVVNDRTVIFKNVIRIEFKTANPYQVTHVYDLKHSKLVKEVKGPFIVDVEPGNYLVQSTKKITKTAYKVVEDTTSVQ